MLAMFIYYMCLSSLSFSEEARNGGSGGFTLDLIHRDSHLSPLHNPNHTHFDRLNGAFHRSISRANRFKPNSFAPPKSIQTDIVPSGGEYFMRISIGTPPLEVLAIADTGSDLTWVQCEPCDLCYDQKTPIFDPKRSSTYLKVLCGTKYCNELDSNSRACATNVKTCGYTYLYGDQSYTDGNLATERFTIGPTEGAKVSLPRIAFGCGTRNGGTFDEAGAGIVGLGGGALSLISQMSTKINPKFSYCLVPTPQDQANINTSKIKFGQNGAVSGPHVVSTPLIAKAPNTYYYATLEAISVGNKRLPYKDSWSGEVEKGNIIIDSGTTLTFLQSEFFTELESAIVEAVSAARISDPEGLFSVCFRDAGGDLELPAITVHFTDADVKLEAVNAFVKAEEDMVCLAMIGSDDIAIYGNLSQMDYLVGFDLASKTVSFMHTDCSKQ